MKAIQSPLLAACARVALALLAFVVAFSCLGCAIESHERDTGGLALVDCAGRSVKVPDRVERIACLYAYTGHVCVLLGCEDKLCAVVQGLKRDHLMERKVQGLQDLSSPYNKGAINIEELVAAAPDIVFLRSDILQDDGELEKLDGTGIPYVVVDYTTAEDQMRSIEVMGESLGCSERAKAEVLEKRDAYQLAQRCNVHLSEHGGNGQGVVGALAAVGLRLSGNDGRVRGKARMTGECATVAELLDATGFDRVCVYGQGMLDGNCDVELNGDEVKAVFQDFSRTVLAVPTPNGRYRLLEKRHLMRY